MSMASRSWVHFDGDAGGGFSRARVRGGQTLPGGFNRGIARFPIVVDKVRYAHQRHEYETEDAEPGETGARRVRLPRARAIMERHAMHLLCP
jgi:hypothetical protein